MPTPRIPKSQKVRYAVVGGGWIAQAAFMPGVANTENSELTALITGDPAKAEVLGRRYGLKTFSYEEYRQALDADIFDAVTLALPNGMHRAFALPALEAGCHLLLEKPMATSVADCEAIIAAAQAANVKLMLARPLHVEPATLDVIARVRGQDRRPGAIGDPRLFAAIVGQRVSPGNHRASQGFWAGPVPDLGPYPIDAARNLLSDEPVAVDASGVNRADSPFGFDESVAVTLTFPQERLAKVIVSYASAPVDAYRIVGTEGDLYLSPGFGFGKPLRGHLTRPGKTEELDDPETDPFGGQTRTFSDCILHDRIPEPDGEEGLADVRVLEAIERALAVGLPRDLPPFQRRTRPDPAQVQTLPPFPPPELVNAAEPWD